MLPCEHDMDGRLSQGLPAVTGSGDLVSLPGDDSLTFSGTVGRTYPADAIDPADYITDRQRHDSEGDWAFCRFSSERIPALRFGYQLGSFNIGADQAEPDPSLLQLHLEVMTQDGGLLWVPTGRFPGEALDSSTASKDVRIAAEDTEILHISGWPQMAWHMRSTDGELEVELEFDIATVTVLPDCLLPQSVFSMWETSGRAQGVVRVGSHREPVNGHVFYDHTRVDHRRHGVAPRQMYLYTTMALEDGSRLFGYHAVDDAGATLDYYCFGVHVDPDGRGTFLAQSQLEDMTFDDDDLPARWRLTWRSAEMTVETTVSVQDLPLKKGWGGPMWPRSRARYSVFPLVLDGRSKVTRAGGSATLPGRGLAEYYDAAKWQT